MSDYSFWSKLLPRNRSVRALVAYSALQGLYLGYINVFWQPFVLTLGFSIFIFGLLEGVSGQFGALSSIVQSIGGRLSDFGRKRIIISGSMILTCTWLVSTLAFAFRIPALIYLAYFLWALGSLGVPVLDATLADNIPPRDRPRVYSIILVANLLPSSLTGYLVGQYSQTIGPSVFLVLAALFEGSGLAILYFALQEVHGIAELKNTVRTVGSSSIGSDIMRTFSNTKSHWRYFSVVSLDTLTWTIGTSLLYALLSQAQNFTKQDFGTIALILPVGVVVGTIPGGWLNHKFGPKLLLIISECLGAFMLLGWALFPLTNAIPVYSFCWGFAIATWVPVQFHLSSELFPQKNRGELMGNLGTVRGLIRGLGPLIALILFLWFGYRGPMIGGAMGILLTIVLIAKFIPAKMDIPTEVATDGKVA